MITTNLFSFSLIIFSLTLFFLTILYSEKIYEIDRGQTAGNMPLEKYFSSGIKSPRWHEIATRNIDGKRLKIGRVHVTNISFDENEKHGDEIEMVDIYFEAISKDVKWSNLFPEWIDETLPWDSSKCPYIPMPDFENYDNLDVVVADVQCQEEGRRDNRDVFRLQLNLVLANLLVKSGKKDNHEQVLAVFKGSCEPMLEIFRCDDLVWHEGNTRIYKPDLERLKQKLLMPVGSCQLAPPFHKISPTSHNHVRKKAKEAYVTVLHSSEDYVCGAIILAQSIIKSNSTKDLILLADDSITMRSSQGLRAAGWKIKHIKRVRSPHAESETYNEWNYSKLRIWELTEYGKLIFIDSDFLILRNTDKFFIYPQLSAAGNNRYLFNSGFMLVEPSTCMFQNFMKQMFQVASYNGGDQGFLNEMFMWWHRWPTKLNYLKDFNLLPTDYMHEIIPNDVYALHYLGFKPWMCHQDDYDCNWDVPENKRFASNLAHRIWWEVYRAMPHELTPHCSFTPEMEDRKKMHIAMASNASRISS